MIAKQPLPLITEEFPHILDDPKSLSPSIDPFTVTTTTGFLPTHRPRVTLPDVFKPLTTLVEDMPIVRRDGTPGLLATYQLGDHIDNKGVLPDLTLMIDGLITDEGQRDLSAVTAAFRDYSFLASAYLLEPCWKHYNDNPDDGYGLGRDELPACIAGPMVKCADILDIPPFLAYAASYALYNYTISDENASSSPINPTYESLSLIRAFERGLDPKSSEAGFVLTHIDMVGHTPGLISGTVSLLDHLTTHFNNHGPAAATIAPDPTPLVNSLKQIDSSLTAIESSMSRMWKNSLPSHYLHFRTFIFGITSQTMFPHGVRYHLPSCLTTPTPENPTPLRNLDASEFASHVNFRGESGANDSIIPLLDSLLQIPFPSNPLTKILHAFRAYRPLPHRTFLSHIRTISAELCVPNVLAYTSFETRYLLMKILDHVRSFRYRHWTFAREYIIRRSKYSVATGGSPIVRWLPNQLEAVMAEMISIWEKSGDNVNEDGDEQGQSLNEKEIKMRLELKEMMDEVYEQREMLKREVKKWCMEREG